MGNAKAEMVQKIPAGISVRVGWPTNNLLRAFRANILGDGLTRVVEIGDRKFCKGVTESTMRTMDDDIAEARGECRSNEAEKLSEQ